MFESCGRPSRRMVVRTPRLRPWANASAASSSMPRRLRVLGAPVAVPVAVGAARGPAQQLLELLAVRRAELTEPLGRPAQRRSEELLVEHVAEGGAHEADGPRRDLVRLHAGMQVAD